MDVAVLRKYRRDQSSRTIQKRAEQVMLTEVEQKSKFHYQFTYQGSNFDPYNIEVLQKNNNTITTSCSCPYDWGGICKHEVAAIDYILTALNKPQIMETDLFGNKIKHEEIAHNKDDNIKKGTVFLEGHQITEAVITWVFKNSRTENFRISNNYFQIIAVSQDQITTNYESWPVANQVFTYNAEENLLKMECSCIKSKSKFCNHIVLALSFIARKLGPSVFSPDYLEDSIDQFLENYGMSRKDDYEKYFNFSMGPEGLQVTEKIKNIVPSIEAAKEELLPQIDDQTKDSLFIKEKKQSPIKTHGIGFCFDFYRYGETYSFSIIPFKAKYKKRSMEFVSSFTEINEYNLIENFKGLGPKDKNSIIAALEFGQTYDRFSNRFTVEDLREASITFGDFITTAKDYPFFEKQYRKNLTKKNISPLIIGEEAPDLSFKLNKKKDFYTLKPQIVLEEKKYQINSRKFDLLPFFCKMEDHLYLFKTPHPYIYINRFDGRSELNFQEKEYPRLYKEVIEPLSHHFEIDSKVYKTSKKESPEEASLKKQVFLSDYEGEYILFKPGVQYGEKLILLHSKEQLFDEQTQEIQQRNASFENNFLEEFKDLHPDFAAQSPPFFLSPQQLIEDEWLLTVSEKMRQQGIEIFGANNLKSFKYNLHKPSLSMGVSSNLDWFDLNIEVKFGKEKVSLKDIRKALVKKSRYVQLSDGSLGILPKKWLDKFSKYFKAGEVKNESIKISNYQFNIIDELHQELETTPQFMIELQNKKQQLQNLETTIEVEPPKNIKANLRPYQVQGLNWLVFLDKNKLGGCLADDMGLGKTLQTIAFLSYLKKHRKSKKPHLVIVPTSLIFNWQKELEKFCPSLKALIYTGPNRKPLFNSFSKFDLVISTYGSLLNDIDFLKDFHFNYVILDESQAIKNPNSKRYKAVRLLQCENRLALTGTPIENNTFDLYAQMNFLNPGLLGSMSHFRKEFSEAIDKGHNEEASALLGKMIHPFLLRRTKEHVATELPEKTETVLYCEMGAEQRKIYDSFKNKFRDYLLNKIDENGVGKSQMYVLEGLTKLRQICNSPELLSDEEDYGKSSIKLDILIDHIKSKTANHKILVFSQFTSMLKLVQERLEEDHLTYEYLDGKTKNREENVRNFQEDPKIRVFLISLKAGGTGLNLTAADYVFLIDPWWNPAVENQAIDRCYRIGQTNHVMAYKMICRDTIEEKIIDLQKNKSQVSTSIIQTDTVKKSFNTKQIKELFS